MALKAAGRTSLVDAVVEQLRAQLTDGAWAVGDRIPTEHDLAEQLGVGRNTVREAVRVLVHAGLLESRQGNGTFVRSTADPAAVLRTVRAAGALDVLELRIALETEAARLAALRRDTHDLLRLRAALATLREEGDRDADADLAFHRAVVEATHNAAFTEVYRFFSAQVHESLVAALGDHEMPAIDLDAHEALVVAVEAGDPEAAGAAARELLREPLETVRAIVAAR
ncbi:FadR family transcriptional regulator [Streptomyces sp. WAC05374]|uniref:FadR/GntR family transcriptional regulator n=1 Tax=Streptomyces sp. WAC05374 TaxID=2487420 RepID=UPI000F875EC7|nr:FadR/GntR family transcriptional regulator [Streptomyces sp. WAC05374]RST17853.1 FadR family transcriptional regulator [Streptomyces sp. WAC05374]TDF38745.1 FadR family transcriptional regulator [Streptomyces sp. WAC05374]TDF56573.1 FadR family transcriptional regulator [Streptomyces sp. WAC05374]TDF60051.1 FadR family transcriptional regulator [Streptomyces sp. WAC05374]